ncbi:lipid-A-disaccharide synthase [Candidatus Kinetoplastibacterium crithidii (ex Angomonas deanei ATCC 30255)]|nr:lipid-A-disaccharide synthase [Candidatus Kinetoplastibacterium crithidii (ex Angomonas deanei ATCC 30255)]
MIKEAVSHMLVVFPFEEEIYRKENIPVTYVGHPLASVIPLKPSQESARKFLNIDPKAQVVAVLPGSRSSEISNLGPIFLQTVKLLNKIRPDLQFIVPMVNESRRSEFENLLDSIEVSNLRCISRRDYENNILINKPLSWYAMEASDLVLLSSGTATLEAALFKKPMIISYVLSPLVKKIMTWQSGQNKPYLPWIGLPNILMNRFVVPEFVQDNATPKKLAEAVLNILLDRTYCSSIVDCFQNMHKDLKLDTPKLVAETIIKVVKKTM